MRLIKRWQPRYNVEHKRKTKLRLHQDHPGTCAPNSPRCPDSPRRRHLLRALSPTQVPGPHPRTSSPTFWDSGIAPAPFPSSSGTSWSFSKRERPPGASGPRPAAVSAPVSAGAFSADYSRSGGDGPAVSGGKDRKTPEPPAGGDGEGRRRLWSSNMPPCSGIALNASRPCSGSWWPSGDGWRVSPSSTGSRVSRETTASTSSGRGWWKRRSPIPGGKAGRQRAAEKIEGIFQAPPPR